MIIGKILGLLGLTLLFAFPAWAEETYENNFDLAENDMEDEGQEASSLHFSSWSLRTTTKKVKWMEGVTPT